MSQNDERKMYDVISSEAQAGSPIRCKDLVCADCKFRYDDSNPERNGKRNGYGRMRGPTSKCEKFDVKPSSVLLGGQCDKHERQ